MGEHSGWGLSLPAPLGLRAAPTSPGRRGTQAPREVWALRARMGGGQGSPLEEEALGEEKHFRNRGGDDGS